MMERREIAFLLDGTTLAPDAQRISRMQAEIERGIDWSELLRIAIPHGVLPLLARNLTTHAGSAIPQATRVQLERFSKRVAERNREQAVELARVVAALSRDGFRVLPFKGPLLARMFYGDMDLRESHDLDLWIDPARFERAMEWFREQGYRPLRHVLGEAQELVAHQEVQEEFWNPEGNVAIEIKARLEHSKASRFDPPFEQAWERRGRTVVNGVEMGLIAAEDLLPSLAVHGSKHMWRRLNWIVDIAAVVSSQPGPDWEQVLARATEWGSRRRLLTAVSLAAELYGTEIPEAMRAEARGAAARATVAHIRGALFEQKLHTFRGLRADFAYHLRSSDSLGERLRYIGDSRHFLARVLQADEARMMLPMSGRMRRVYGAFATVRNWFGAAGVKPLKVEAVAPVPKGNEPKG